MHVAAAALAILVWDAPAPAEPGRRGSPALLAAAETRAVQNEPALAHFGTAVAPGVSASVETPAARAEPAEGAAEERAAPSVQLSIEGTAGTRGEGSAQVVALFRDGALAFGLGAEGALGPLAPARQGLVLQGEVAAGFASFHGELRVRPEQDGAARSAAELGARVESAAGNVDLSVRAVSALASGWTLREARAELTAAGAALEAELPLDGQVAVGLRAGASFNQLRWTGPRSPHPWDALGTAVLEWPDRWEGQASLRAPLAGAAVTALIGAAGPAAPGALALRGGARAELETGSATLAVALAAAHQWPADLWLAELSFSAAFRFGGHR